MIDVLLWTFLIANVVVAANGLAQGSSWVLNALAATVLAIVVDERIRDRARIKRKRELGGRR